ncbi:MAG: ATP-binding protein, partial [Bdellovibrionales bacterium]|nr:ATP-binding protein [Bdellovibrionales bacterium]
SRVQVDTVVEEIVFDLHHSLRDAGAEVTVEEIPPLCIEKVRLRQLLQNLIQNSLRYREPSRPLKIKVSVAGYDRQRHFVTLVVEDNGRGFPPERGREIFQPFRRFNSEGVGLGLALCKKIALSYGGDIKATGRPDQGASFYVRLPVWSVKEQTEPAAEEVMPVRIEVPPVRFPPQ